ncbi:MAG: Peptidase, family [Rickettsiaceae bacterium]|jgi:murein DD-endopeptidase MepM/ murein hydrolase activator NlpD|nr:Peptidase, family [Rickettsiaceae bacterium]
MSIVRITASRILILALRISYFIVVFLKKVFGKKTILLVSKQQIKSYSVGPLTQVTMLLVLFWIVDIFITSLRYSSIVEKKSIEISNLKKANSIFEERIDSINASLKEINDYFISVSGYSNEKKQDQKSTDEKVSDLFGNLKLNSQGKEIATKIADSSLVLDNIKDLANKRIADLNQKFATAGITLVSKNRVAINNHSNEEDEHDAISLNNKDELSSRQGGPFYKFKNPVSSFTNSKIFKSDSNFGIKSEIEYLSSLERLIHFAPLSAPMKNYYVSSIFGKRVDPIKKVLASHKGMDFVGKNSAQIISPSIGKVIFAGKYSTYGNTIIIDHGYGLTTRYGHLSKLNVKEGDIVQKSQVIAIQGSTGRSTGQHLHYEVRYKNTPLNPRKFLQAGQEILN